MRRRERELSTFHRNFALKDALSSREVDCQRFEVGPNCQRLDAILAIRSGILVVESELSTCNLNLLLFERYRRKKA